MFTGVDISFKFIFSFLKIKKRAVQGEALHRSFNTLLSK
jgi:hypothetical protein